MTDILEPIDSILIGYLLGSLPRVVWLCGRLTGRDIRELSDGNSGARNMTHVLRFRAGITVGLADFCKGWLGVWAAREMGAALIWPMAAGASAVISHDFLLFDGLRGRQGMATSLGTMMIL